AIHNTAGAAAIEKLGLKRAIVARELSVDEIRRIQKGTSIELELFIHGALCYCFSGLCLASSYLGGLSGNRGRCTQVCRRRFSNRSQSGFFFSPRDFSALDYIGELTDMNIASFKIEGRMRSAEYVYTVVSAFRKILDTPDQIQQAREMLRLDFGREKTSFFLQGRQSGDVLTADKPSGTGLFLGTVTGCSDTDVVIDTDEQLFIGDRIRIHGQAGFEGKAARIQAVLSTTGSAAKVSLTDTLPAERGDLVYLVSRKQNRSSSWNQKKVPVSPARFSKQPRVNIGLLKKYEKNRFPSHRKTESLVVRIDDTGWLYTLHKDDYHSVQFAATLTDGQKLIHNKHLLNRWRSALSVVLPPFISEYDMTKWQKLLKQFSSAGIRRGVASQFGQKQLFPPGWEVTADYTVWTTNRFSQYVLGEAGYQGFSYSPEDDFVNVRACAHSAGMVTVFGYIPLFVSRIRPAIEPGSQLLDPRREAFFVARRGELFYLLGKKPVGLTHRRTLLLRAGISIWLIDLSFMPPHKKMIKSILQSCNTAGKIPDTTVFNHKAGLK
ncbi:MAG: peptidase U32 family protein, partial [Chitinivibrionales bacterium]